MMKIPRSPYDRLVNVVGVCSLGGTTAWLLAVWKQIAARIPVHYDFRGHVDRMAGKGSLWVLMAVGWVMFLALSVVEHFPQIWNTGRGAGDTEKSGEGVSHTEKYAGYPETYHCGAVFLSGISVCLWWKSAAAILAAVFAGNLRVIGVFPAAAH